MKTKTKSAAAKAKPATKKPAAKDAGGKITLIAKSCPSKSGTVRAKRWAQLKNGMTVAEAAEKKIPVVYLRRMEKAGHLKID
jgi:hypothetical protein